MNLTRIKRIATIFFMLTVLLFVCNAKGPKRFLSSNAPRDTVILNQSFPDTLSVRCITVPLIEKPLWQTNLQALAYLIVGILSTLTLSLIFRGTSRINLRIMRENARSQFLQNNTRIWVHDVIDTMVSFLSDVTLLSTDTRHLSCKKYGIEIPESEAEYMPMNENKRLELRNKIDLTKLKLKLLLSNEADGKEKQIVGNIDFLYRDAENMEIMLLDAKEHRRFNEAKEEVTRLTNELLLAYRNKVKESY